MEPVRSKGTGKRKSRKPVPQRQDSNKRQAQLAWMASEGITPGATPRRSPKTRRGIMK